MEHFKSPFVSSEFSSVRAVENQRFFDDVLERAQSHRYFSHPFMSAFEGAPPSREVVTFFLTSMYKLVAPFTGLLCSLGGNAPNLHSRFALMDNIYEEMGCGNFDSAHPMLYLKMLTSIGVSSEMAEQMPTLASIRRINDHLREVVDRGPFSVACAMLALAEIVIPPTFPVLSTMARSAFPDIDMTFFDRHGVRDEGHSDDASMLFAVSADASHYEAVEVELRRALDYRCELFDEWMEAAEVRRAPSRARISERPRPFSERPRLGERARPRSERVRPLSAAPKRPATVPPSGR